MTDKSVTISDAAARRIASILGSSPEKQALRVSVEGGGCSGFSYKFDLVADHRAMYYLPITYAGLDPIYIGQGGYFFGDILAYKSGDAFATALISADAAVTSSSLSGNVWYGANLSAGTKLLRSYAGLGGAVDAWTPPMSGTTNVYSGEDPWCGAFPACPCPG